jgi:hypothetical protein
VPKWAQTTGGVVISVLFAGNVFFVARLVDQLDATREMVWQLRQEVVLLTAKVEVCNRESHNQKKGDY